MRLGVSAVQHDMKREETVEEVEKNTEWERHTPRLPLSRQKEFKQIRNTVIEETLRLNDDAAAFDPTVPEEFLSEQNIPEANPVGEASPESELPVETGDIGEDSGETLKHRGRPKLSSAIDGTVPGGTPVFVRRRGTAPGF